MHNHYVMETLVADRQRELMRQADHLRLTRRTGGDVRTSWARRSALQLWAFVQLPAVRRRHLRNDAPPQVVVGSLIVD